MSPKVSVIVPNYNHAAFLERRIQSILNQTFQDFELLYLDDASQDNSNDVVARFLDDSRIKTVVNQTNTGIPFKQWNKGVGLARGEYIWLAESDDYADPMFLETMVGVLERNPAVGVAYCQSWSVDEKDQIIGSWLCWTEDLDCDRWKSDFVNSGLAECQQFMIFKNTIPNASAVLLRRSVYEQAGFADETMKLCGDWLTWLKLLQISDIAFVATSLNYFRTHTRSVRSDSKVLTLYARESYQVLKYIVQHLNLPRSRFDQACETLADRWVQSLEADREAGYEQRHRQIYRLACRVDPHLKDRLIKRMARLLPKLQIVEQPVLAQNPKTIEAELERSQAIIAAMESSKFWQLRTAWVRVKRRLGMAQE